MRNLGFAVAYWTLSIIYSLLALILTLFPGRKPVVWIIQRYTRRMVTAMNWFAGIRLEVRGRENIPAGQAVIFACKHQSWGDGFCIYSQFDDLAFVTGDHLEKYPFMSTLLTKLGAIVVNSCGGIQARKALANRSAEAARDGRHILIYPEGHLSKVGTYHRYRSGVWHMMNSFSYSVVPVATNLGLFWPQEGYEKHPGTAIIEFLEPIAPGMSKEAFLTTLRDRIETRSQELIAETTGAAFQTSVLVTEKDEPRQPSKA